MCHLQADHPPRLVSSLCASSYLIALAHHLASPHLVPFHLISCRSFKCVDLARDGLARNLEVSHEDYSTEWSVASEDDLRQQKLIEARARALGAPAPGVEDKPGPGPGPGPGQGAGGNKALPSPGDVLRMNAENGAATAAASGPPPVEKEKFDKDSLMKMIAEEVSACAVTAPVLEI